MRLVLKKEIIPAGTYTATFNTRNTPIYIAGAGKVVLCVKVTNTGGTSPTLDITLQTYDSITDSWYDVGSMSTITADGYYIATFDTNLAEAISVLCTIGGTDPTFDIHASVYVYE